MGRPACAPAARGLQLPPSGLSLPRGGRMWAPRGRPEPSGPGTGPGRGACQSPRGAGRAGRGRGAHSRPGPRAARSPSRSRSRARARAGGAGCRAQGGAGGAGGGSPVLTSAGAVHPGAGALRAGGSWRGGGLGRRPHIPPVAGGCRATERRREEGRGPGGGGPWQPGRPGRMTMEGNALSESESGPRGRGGRGQALAARGHTSAADTARRGARAAGGHPARPGRRPRPRNAGRGPDPRAAAALPPSPRRTIPGNPDT